MNKLYSYFLLLLLVPALQAKKSSYFSYNEKKNGITLDIQELSPKQARKKLGYHFKGRRSDSIAPLACTVANCSDRTIKLSKEDIGLELVLSDLVRKKAEVRSRMIAAGWIGVSILISPLFFGIGSLISLAVILNSGNVGLASFVPLFVGSVIAITPIATGCYQWKKSKKSIAHKIIRPYDSVGTIELKPGESVEFNLYTRKKALASPFSMTVHDVDSQHVGSQQKTQFMVAA